jgi:hypothetical protein
VVGAELDYADIVLVASGLVAPGGQPIARVIGACKVVKGEKVG